MNSPFESLTVQAADDADIEGMRTLLNEIIRAGGMSAITNELSSDEMREWFISGEAVVSCFVAVDSVGAIVGFQSLSKYGTLPAGWVGGYRDLCQPIPPQIGRRKRVICPHARGSVNARLCDDQRLNSSRQRGWFAVLQPHGIYNVHHRRRRSAGTRSRVQSRPQTAKSCTECTNNYTVKPPLYMVSAALYA